MYVYTVLQFKIQESLQKNAQVYSGAVVTVIVQIQLNIRFISMFSIMENVEFLVLHTHVYFI